MVIMEGFQEEVAFAMELQEWGEFIWILEEMGSRDTGQWAPCEKPGFDSHILLLSAV